jgi:hypothetical protein
MNSSTVIAAQNEISQSLVRVATGQSTIKDAKLLAIACGMQWAQVNEYVRTGNTPNSIPH